MRERQNLHDRLAAAERTTSEHALLIDVVFESRSWTIGHALTRVLRLFRSRVPSAADRWRAMKDYPVWITSFEESESSVRLLQGSLR